MKTAIDSVKDGGKKIKKRHNTTKENRPTLNEIKEDGKEDEDKSRLDDDELELEAQDEVQELNQLGGSPNKPAAVPSIRDSRMSSRSSVFIAKLQAEIEEERKEREKLQKEMDEMKKLSSELLSQLQGKN